MGILDLWEVSVGELDEIVAANPSLRGFLFGYVSEHKLRKMWFSDERISNLIKYDNHDRTRKSDITFTYKEVEISVEAKSLQTGSIRKADDGYTGRFQCDASDRRQVSLPNGEAIETTSLVVGEFDLLAVNLSLNLSKSGASPLPRTATCPGLSTRNTLLSNKSTFWRP